MKTWRAILLVGFLVLWAEMQPASSKSIPHDEKKPGLCPTPPGTCKMLNPPNNCNYDYDCQGPLKCCQTICGRDCVNPV